MMKMDVSRTRGAVLIWSLVVGGAVVAAYLAFLGWDQQRDVDPETLMLTGPYQPWQVVGLAAVIGVLAFEAGRRGHPWVAVLVAPFVLTVCFAIDAVTETENDGLWAVGAVLLAVGSLLGVGLMAGFGVVVRYLRRLS